MLIDLLSKILEGFSNVFLKNMVVCTLIKAKDFMLWAFGHNLKMYHMPILRAYAAYAFDSVAIVKKERDT